MFTHLEDMQLTLWLLYRILSPPPFPLFSLMLSTNFIAYYLKLDNSFYTVRVYVNLAVW
jgi:hypothetical protein